ncbi:dihydrofolate reductase [Candidatus Saccharibacteria bacterium]|nr:dihydrofolate reductase [Candidatus Saccharibacteria bacterium]
MFSIIAVVGKNRELGKQGRLVFELPEDMGYFKEKTMGHKVVMGRKTWESLPGKLAVRENIVVSRGEVTGADRIVRDLPEFIRENQDSAEEIFVIGGEAIYRDFLPVADNLYLTEVDAEVPEADTWFPEFKQAEFGREVLGEGRTEDLSYKFVRYERR